MSGKHLQNRVDPWGALHAVSDYGTLMGNRGILHDQDNRIVRPWAHQNWVACLLSFKSIKRPRPFSPGNYSELFFLDEATALSAGHRPCACCQRERYLKFKSAWLKGNATEALGDSASTPNIDRLLHKERAVRGGAKQTFEAELESLPRGVMFEWEDVAYLVSDRGVLPWSFKGYGASKSIERHQVVRVLTPASIVRAVACGFSPRFHWSANELA